MRRKQQSRRGQSIWLFALGLIAFFGFLAIVLDFGRIFLVKQRLHNHCDAAALAGALNLPEDPAGAVDKAVEYYARNTHSPSTPEFVGHGDSTDTSLYNITPKPMKDWRNETPADLVRVTTPYQDAKTQALHLSPDRCIEVYAEREIINFLGQLMGRPTVHIRTRAVAFVTCEGEGSGGAGSDNCVSEGLVPIGYPVTEPPNWTPPPGMPTYIPPLDWVVGQRYQITHPGSGVQGNQNYLAIQGRGGNALRTGLKYGIYGRTLCPGDVVETEPGVKNGIVADAINFRYDQCPTETWDSHSDSCPRVVTILIIDPWYSDYRGRCDVEVVGAAQFFLDRYIKGGHSSDDARAVYGWFLGFIGNTPSPGGSGDDDDSGCCTGDDDDSGGGGGDGGGGGGPCPQSQKDVELVR